MPMAVKCAVVSRWACRNRRRSHGHKGGRRHDLALRPEREREKGEGAMGGWEEEESLFRG